MTQSKTKLVVATAFLIVVCVGFFAAAGLAHTEGDTFMAGLMTVFGVYLAAVLPYGLVMRFPARRTNPDRFNPGGTRSGEPGLIAKTPPAKVTVALVATVISALSALALLGLVELGGLLPLVLAIVIGALPVATLVRALRGRLHRGHVALSPSGVELQTWTSGVSVPWSEIAEIRVSDRSRNPVFIMLLLDDRDADESTVDTWHLAGHMWRTALPAWEPSHRVATVTVEHTGIHIEVLLLLLYHYWNHPEQRGELSTQVALHRLRHHQLDMPESAEPGPDQTSTDEGALPDSSDT